MKKSITMNETQLHNLIFESVRQVLNELSYDDWKLMTPEEDAGLSSDDYKITIAVSTDESKLNNWGDCQVFDVVNNGDGSVTFKVTYNDNLWIGKYDDESDITGHAEDSAYDFVECHGGADGGYEIVGFEKI